MDIAVMGAGGVGGYFGGMLARAGNRVTFVARGDHLKAIETSGLRVVHHQGDFTVTAEATDNPQEVGPVELVLFTVKAYDTEAAIPAVASILGPDTSVLTLQNGVDSYKVLGQALGKEKVLPGAAYIESRISSPGMVQQTGDVVRIVFGEVDGKETPRATRIHAALRDAGVNAELSGDVLKTLWTKFLFITSVAGLTSACRTGLGMLLEEPEYKGILVAAMKEIEAVGRAHGINLDSDVVQQTMGYVESVVKDITASMHVDLERGRRLELDTFSGAVVRLGKEVGVDTPINELLYLVLKPHINGRGV
ncbi:MAG: 2-dehydropantoate 2-reductase [Dehalococcoidia bacterium]